MKSHPSLPDWAYTKAPPREEGFDFAAAGIVLVAMFLVGTVFYALLNIGMGALEVLIK